MCLEHILTQDPERLLEQVEEQPETEAGTGSKPDQRSRVRTTA
jgi:hypothetical protein